MNKTIKTIIIIIMALGILLLLPDAIKGFTEDSITNGYTQVQNHSKYCLEGGQDNWNGTKYSKYAEIEISSGGIIYETKSSSYSITNENEIRFIKGLMYILSNEPKGNYPNNIQTALWNYLNVHSDKRNSILGNMGNTKSDHLTFKENGEDIYDEANRYCNGYRDNITWKGKISLYKASGEQHLLNIDEKPEEQEMVPTIKLRFQKKDFNGTINLSNAIIEIIKSTNVNGISSNEMKSTAGSFGTVEVTPISSNPGTFDLIIREKESPNGYAGLPNEVKLTVTYNKETGSVNSITANKNSNYFSFSTGDIGTVTIKNKPEYNLIIKKIDALTGSKLPGVRFKIELTNVESIGNYQIAQTGTGETQNPPRVVYVKTDDNGEIKLTGIVPKSVGTDITATITEVEVPKGNGYYYNLINDPIEVTLNKNAGSTTIKTITNQPLIDLSGMVWEDGQIGEKNVAGPNGKKDSGESGRAGVLVGLKRVSDNKIIKSVITGEDGKYSFIGIPYLGENSGYQIVFSYDGINWQETKSIRNATDGDSDATEQDRTTFNNKFKIISKGQSNAVTGLTYSYNNNISKLDIDMAGNTTGTKDAKFQIKAQTGTYKITTSNIDCGLVKKEFDLALGTDVKSATLKINDKETTYSYAQIMNGDLEDVDLDKILQNNSSTSDVDYNLYLYTSDYNYRISDYKTGDDAIKNTVNTDDNTVNSYENLKELKAYITYSVILKNQTTYNATVEQFVYYYDAAYIPQFKVDDVISGYKVLSIENNKITFESVNSEENILQEANSYRKEIDLTFEVRPDDNGNITTKTATNVAEITKYSTVEGGLIDKDSEPGNAIVEFKNGTPTVIDNYEDDTDEAKGINISVREDEVRTITGTVFDDTYKKDEEENNVYDKDGILNNENTPVNDVIVQLIEIKKIGGQYYEYIWQETRSGSNQVKTTARNGYPGETYTNSVAQGSGMYEFKDFIPGNYIIRYIYGDGTTYDSTDNVKTYNGQDYKSTIDANYNKAWYNTAEYTDGQSVARDNEARRLEVMAYSTTIDKEIGKALDEKTTLDKTWMCAETSRINVPVDASDNATDASLTTASYDYTKENKKVVFDNVNFGLALRPKTNLVLEKHITGLKITPSGIGVQPIVDARANIESIVNGTEVATEGVTQGLATIKSTRENRGFWQVATDVEELAQGAQLEVEYTYVIRNDSEEDYLSIGLLEAYETQNVKPYNEVLLEIKDTVKEKMKSGTYSYDNNNQIGTYLGQTYYRGLNEDGSVPTTDRKVSSRIETLEEALNNDLTFDSETSGTDFKASNTEGIEKTVYDMDGNAKTEKINTVIVNNEPTTSLRPKTGDNYTKNTADYSKTITLRTVLSSSTGGELGTNIPSYIAEVVKYSNAAGRRDMGAEPENLSYVHSDDTGMTLENSWLYELEGTLYETQNKDEIPEGATNIREANERDEFWGETIIITKPTGEDKLTPLQIAIITISSIAVIGVGIVLIKKFVLKK